MVGNLVGQDARETHVVLWGRLGRQGGGRGVMSFQRRNQTRACLYAKRESGASVTRGDLTVAAWRKSKTLLQLSAMVANVLAVD